MNESKSNVPNMYQTIPAVAALNRVPGFEPMKLLRPAISRKTNEKVLKLGLSYKKLWFKLAHPRGRIWVRKVIITEKIAIYEALVYLDRSDEEPISNFTGSCLFDSEAKNNYVKEAQEEAVNGALSLAGFGPQFADVEMTEDEERFGSEILMSAMPTQIHSADVQPIQKPAVSENEPTQKNVIVKPADEQIKPAVKDVEPVKEQLPIEEAEESELPVSPAEDTLKEETGLPVEPVPSIIQQEKVSNTASLQDQSVHKSQDTLTPTQRAMQILQNRANGVKTNPTPQMPTIQAQKEQESASQKYTRDMPVPEILKVMTFEEAQNVVIDIGICKGKTMKEVAETRPASLKYYLFGGYKEGNNILLAAAKIMYDYLYPQKLEKAG